MTTERPDPKPKSASMEAGDFEAVMLLKRALARHGNNQKYETPAVVRLRQRLRDAEAADAIAMAAAAQEVPHTLGAEATAAAPNLSIAPTVYAELKQPNGAGKNWVLLLGGLIGVAVLVAAYSTLKRENTSTTDNAIFATRGGAIQTLAGKSAEAVTQLEQELTAAGATVHLGKGGGGEMMEIAVPNAQRNAVAAVLAKRGLALGEGERVYLQLK